MNLKIYKAVLIYSIFSLTGCSLNNFHTDNIEYYVSPIEYSEYDCNTITLAQEECIRVLKNKKSIHNYELIKYTPVPAGLYLNVINGHLNALQKEYKRKKCND